MRQTAHEISGHEELPAHLILSVFADLKAAIDAVRQEMTKRALLAPIGEPLQLPGAKDSGARSRIEQLTQRQRQVLAGIVRGCANKVIAWELGLSIRTVEAYRAKLLERLGARNTADAVRLALAAGFDADAASSPANR